MILYGTIKHNTNYESKDMNETITNLSKQRYKIFKIC